jgi:hypothetical protein
MEKSSFESTQEFFDLWLKTYEATFGRLVEMPAMGPAREKSEKMMKGFSTFVELYTTWMDSNVNFQSVFMEAMRRMREKTATEMEGEISPEKYKDFYKIWIETYSETFKEFLKSGHFASDMGKLMSHFMEFQKFNREMVEENYLKPMNLPTKTEIDEINKELYSLKKAVKESNLKTKDLPTKTEIDEINKELDSLKGTVKESNLKTMDLPTKTEIDEINKELYSLKETVGELTSQIKEYLMNRFNEQRTLVPQTKKDESRRIHKTLMNPSKKDEYPGVHQTKKK